MKKGKLKDEATSEAEVVIPDSKKGLTPMLFELSWGSYDLWSYYLFIHFEKTQKQFQKDIRSLLVKYGKEYLKQEEDLWLKAE